MNASGIAIRAATVDDVPQLAELRWSFAAEDGPPREAREEFLSRFLAFALSALDGPRWRAWVAEIDGVIVGCAWLRLIDRIPRPDSERPSLGYLTNVYVTPYARNRGVGAQLVGAATEAAKRCGCAIVVLWPSEASVRFYARVGFKATDALELRFDV